MSKVIEIDGERFQEVELTLRQIAYVTADMVKSDEGNRRLFGQILAPVVKQLADALHIQIVEAKS